MNDSLDKVLDIAKRLRSLAKKTNDSKVQDLVTDLNLSLADLKVELIEQRHQPDTTTTTAATTTTRATTEQPAQTTEPAVALTSGQPSTSTDDDSEFTY